MSYNKRIKSDCTI